MHYPLSFITRDYDRIVCWGFPKGTVHLDIEIFPKFDRKTHKKIAKQKQLQEIIPEDEKLRESFRFASSNVKLAKQFILEPKLQRSLSKSKNYLKRLSISQRDSRIYLIGELHEESLKPLLDLFMSCGQVMA